ncbi:PEPxxWA-CTERM sorting domain-containing protein [Glacieibacterium frigidum]|uniref:PEPxxWA-CTERM sorting domain-containing protein n=1 Tax=Glacieibacterium frigidum TaxID=2593303 RepID=UPI001F40E608|nr:PEPxxWA-CTERM sorting domain-containing protein [Glacieibacterium frigidum]
MSFIKAFAVAAALLASGAANAAITVYTDQASFLAAVSAPGVDGYDGFNIFGTTNSPITRSAGSYGYTASAGNGFFGAGTVGDPWLSTTTATDPIVLNAFTGGVRGVGGLFFGSDIGGSFQAGDVVLNATDASGTVTRTILNATTSSFLGFVTDGAFTSISIASVQPGPGSFLWPTIENLTLAGAAVAPGVPEPASWALMIGGFGLVGAAMRRKALAAA